MFGYDPKDYRRSCYTVYGIYKMAEDLLSELLVLRGKEIKVKI